MKEVAEKYPNDGVVMVYLERIEGFIANPPPPNRDGITRFSQK